MSTQPVSFDAPLQQATTVSVPAGVTFDAPTSSATTVDLSQPQKPIAPGTVPNTTGATSTAAQARPGDTISATPDPSGAAERAEQWASNVAYDMKYGTDLTGIGSVLKSMGAHGVYMGSPEAVGDFMASLPLGFLKAVKGTAELAQSGKRWQGTKDVAGGGLQAATLPSAFVAPEGAEALSTGAGRVEDAITSGAGKAVAEIKKSFSLDAVRQSLQAASDAIKHDLAGKTQNIQTGFHDAVRSLFGDVAADAGVKPAPAQSLHDLAGNIAAAIETKAKGLYSQIDQAMGGTAFQTYNQQIDNVRRALRTSAGINPDADGRLIERINDLEDAKSKAWELAKQAGVNPDLGDAANALWRQKSALEDLGKQVQGSITGLRADLANGVQAAQETLSPAKLSTRANRLYNTGRLQQAIGERADDLLRATESTKQRLQDAVTSAAEQTKAAKGTAAQQSAVVSRNRALATSSAGAVGAGGVFELLRHLLGE